MYDENYISASWCKLLRRSDKLVIVEDQISAYKVAPFCHSLALLGVNLNEEKLEEIMEQIPAYKQIYLCLDNDATFQAIKLQLKWRNKLPQLQVVGLPKDIKDMNDQEFQDFKERLV